jgi:hypothetical protein
MFEDKREINPDPVQCCRDSDDERFRQQASLPGELNVMTAAVHIIHYISTLVKAAGLLVITHLNLSIVCQGSE